LVFAVVRQPARSITVIAVWRSIVGIPYVQPAGAIPPQHPPQLAKDGDDMLDVELDSGFHPETAPPDPALAAEAPHDIELRHRGMTMPASPVLFPELGEPETAPYLARQPFG
jgi:hypothetical protein